VSTFKSPTAEIDRLTSWDHYLAWGGGASGSANEVWLLDRRTGRARKIAQATKRQGQTDWAVGTGRLVVFTDQAAMQTSEATATPWTIRVVDIITGKDRVVAGDAGLRQDFVPLPTANYPWAAWTQVRKDARQPELVIADLRDRTTRVLMKGVTASRVSIVSGYVYYDADSGPRRRDVFRVKTTGGVPQQITHTGQVGLPQATTAGLLWQQPQQQDPTAIWTAELDGSNAKAVFQGASQGNAVPGPVPVFIDADGHPASPGASASLSRPVSDDLVYIPARLAGTPTSVCWAVGGPRDASAIRCAALVRAVPGG